jgi:hypothetical protein
MQSLVQAFGEEFASHVGKPCPLRREFSLHKLVDWDAAAGRFAYDLAYADKQPDWGPPRPDRPCSQRRVSSQPGQLRASPLVVAFSAAA